jgi:acyl-CoA reductase-like NAD-dependent aldehyde dehydrogenase
MNKLSSRQFFPFASFIKMPVSFSSFQSYGFSSSSPDHHFQVFNPATGEVITTIAGADANTTHAAITKSKEAFKSWRTTTLVERSTLLLKCADALANHQEELAEILCLENGKPYLDALSFDIKFVIGVFRFFGSLIDKLPTNFHDRGTMYVSEVREPKGVTAGILPFNWPPLHFGGKTAPSIAAGNTIIIKPGEQAPLTVMRMLEIVNTVLPEGVVQAVPAKGIVVPQTLTTSPDVKMVSFTGSTLGGAAMAKSAFSTENGGMLKPLALELGGKNAFIVFQDADLEKAVKESLEGAFFNKGEACTAGSRLLIHGSVYDKFVERLGGYIKKLRVGDGMDPQTHIGPCISKVQQERVQKYLRIGVEEDGAQIVAQAPVPTSGKLKSGYYIQPTLFANVTPNMRIAQEEMFGPIVTATSFKDEEEAISIANSSAYGLTAVVFTRDMEKALRVGRELEAGMVYLNNYRRNLLGLPFGGIKESGFGREHCIETLGEWSNTKFMQFPSGKRGAKVEMWRAVNDVCE